MLSYQHGYHAGNFADVIKHLTLTCLINYLTQKDKPAFYLETHAGRGLYDLQDGQARKTAEFESGIALLWANKANLPPVFNHYIESISKLNANKKLRYYPGSPALAIDQFREQDRLFCCELHSGEFEFLQQLPKQRKKVFFSPSDGLHNLKAQLPPQEKRGLIFIDPAYEIKNEYKEIPQSIKASFAHFASGVYCLWYPIIDNFHHQQIIRGMSAIPTNNKLRLEFYLTAATGSGMTGCGLWILNPPYTLADEIQQAMKYLRQIFNPGVSSFLLES